eukprot:gene11634-15584_t
MTEQAIMPLEEGWNNYIKFIALDPLEKLLDEGFKTKKTKLFSNQDYMLVYTTCYNMCTQKTPFNWSEQLYQRHGETIANYLSKVVLPALNGKRDTFLLSEFVLRGENHNVMNKWYKMFFTYLDRYHVKYHQLPSLEEAGLKQFKTVVYDTVKKDVTASIIELVESEREGTVIDKDIIRSCVKLFETMGMGTLDCYIGDFENHLLDATRAYYARKAEVWILEDSTPEYLVKVEKALEDEKHRVSSYLNPESEQKLLRAIEQENLEKKETELIEKEGSGCRVLLTNDMFVDLARMFRLFSRIPDGLVPIAEIFKQYIIDLGNDKIELRLSRVDNNGESKDPNGEKESSDDPQFMKDLLGIHDKFISVVQDQFNGNTLFQKALKEAFTDLVNRDVGKFKTAELISSFCDRLLKTGSSEKLSDAEIEEFLEKTVQMFSYLTDKDLFAEIYRNQLAKRLLNQRSASDDMERLVIGKLKSRCGAQFTSKMEGMLNDLSMGTEQSQIFERVCKENNKLGKLEFSVQILTTGYWPSYKSLDINLPPVMQKATQVFKEYYDAKTTHRRLQWTYSLGNAVVKGTFGKKTYDIQVTTLQAVALLSFNDDQFFAILGAQQQQASSSELSLSFTALLDNLGMTEEALKRVLHSLSCGKYKILKKISEDVKDKTIKVTDSFAFNEQFTCNMRKIRIPMASLEDSHSTKRVEEDRSVAIEAAVVRIMKARKTLAHQQLVAEVLTQLAFFKPDPKLIKRRIEALIDREYLERDPDNANTYRYLA